MEVYLVRHTTPKVEKGICYGQTDLDVAETFDKEMVSVLNQLPDSVDYVYSSPLKRCLKLAQQIPCNKSIVTDKRLMELNFGDWEMKSWDGIPKREMDPWMQNYVHQAPPNGESMLQLQNRVLDWWSALKNPIAERIAVVAHAGVLRCLWAYFEEIPLKDTFSKFKIEYGTVVALKNPKT